VGLELLTVSGGPARHDMGWFVVRLGEKPDSGRSRNSACGRARVLVNSSFAEGSREPSVTPRPNLASRAKLKAPLSCCA
jgi:hypothetical protein